MRIIDSVKRIIKSYTITPYIIGSNLELHPTAELDNHTFIDCKSGKLILGEKTHILPFATIMTHGGTIEFGSYCTVNPYTIIYGHGGVKIGDAVRIAAHCTIIPANHVFEDPNKQIRQQGITKQGIIIEDDVWIGTGCRILDGITIGKGSVVAAGAVVNNNIPEFSIYGGVPAKKIGERG